MKSAKILLILIFSFYINNFVHAKDPGLLITEIVNEASSILSSSDPVESKIIKLNDIAERNVDIDGIGMYALGKYRKIISDDQKITTTGREILKFSFQKNPFYYHQKVDEIT